MGPYAFLVAWTRTSMKPAQALHLLFSLTRRSPPETEETGEVIRESRATRGSPDSRAWRSLNKE